MADLEYLGELLQDTSKTVDYFTQNRPSSLRLSLYGIKAAVITFKNEGFQLYVKTCLEGSAKIVKLQENEKQLRQRELTRLDGTLNTVLQSIQTHLVELSRNLKKNPMQQTYNLLLAMFGFVQPHTHNNSKALLFVRF